MRFGKIVLCFLVCLIASGPASADFQSDVFAVPVVARNAGRAHTVWRTEICISNVYESAIMVRLDLIRDGESITSEVEVPPDATTCSEDFLLEWFGLEVYRGGLQVSAPLELNPDLNHWVKFALSVRIYNVTAAGSYGTTVTPIPRIPWLEQHFQIDGSVAPGLRHFGKPGVEGFRSSIGVFVPDEDEYDAFSILSMSVYDESGDIVWEHAVPIEGKSHVQFPLPGNLDIHQGKVEFVLYAWAASEVYPYITVTDNRTGDGWLTNVFGR